MEGRRLRETNFSEEDNTVSLCWKQTRSSRRPNTTGLIKYHDGSMFLENNGVGLFAFFSPFGYFLSLFLPSA